MAKHPKIKVSILISGGKKEVAGFSTVCPYLAVTPSADTSPYYTITHIPTGMAVVRYIKQRKAFKLAGAISGIFDWQESTDEAFTTQFEALPLIIQRWLKELQYS